MCVRITAESSFGLGVISFGKGYFGGLARGIRSKVTDLPPATRELENKMTIEMQVATKPRSG